MDDNVTIRITGDDEALRGQATQAEKDGEAQKWREIGREFAIGFAEGLADIVCALCEKTERPEE